MQTSSDGFYLGFECHSCGTRIEIVIDDGSDDCHFVGEDVLQIRCSRCHRDPPPSDKVTNHSRRVNLRFERLATASLFFSWQLLFCKRTCVEVRPINVFENGLR